MDADLTDRDLVAAALGGDRPALAGIYDRYGARVHDLCLHMLGDRDEAADAAAEVFLIGFSRLGQLRDPERLRPWLFAIARHEVYRRSRERSRTRPVEEVEEMDPMLQRDELGDDVGGDPAALASLLRSAAAGLDEADLLVMELQLQGLDGEELAAALGTSVATGYQRVHRMKERLGRSVGAVLVARQGRRDCPDLDRLLAGWDGAVSVRWRKRVARHVDRCEICERRRRAVPAALFGGAAMAVPLLPVSAVSAAPASVRDRVLSGAVVGAGPGRGGAGRPDADGWRWLDDGFPATEHRSRAPLVAAAVAVVLALLMVGAWTVRPTAEDELAADETVPSAPTTTVATSSTSTTGVPTTTVVAAPPTTVAVPTTTAPAPTATTVPPVAVPPGAPTTTTAVPAPVEVAFTSLPRVLYRPTPGAASCGASTDVVVAAGDEVVAVEVRWSDATGATGSVALTRSGGEWRGRVEVPEGGQGPATLRAVARDAGGATGTTAEELRRVANCPTPG